MLYVTNSDRTSVKDILMSFACQRSDASSQNWKSHGLIIFLPGMGT